MKKASWIIVLLVGLVIGVTADRMLGGAGTSRPAPRPAPAPAAPPVEDPRAVYRMPVDDTPLRGPADALVTIVVASDFQCPFCKRVEPTLQAMADAFPGKVRVGWRHQPLPGHAKAIPAAVAAEEARAQGGDAKFWAMHDKLFELSPALDRPDLERAAREVGVDPAGVDAALDQGKHMDRIRRDQALCQSLVVRATPTLFVNGRKIEGALPPEQLKPIVQQELDKAEALVASGVKPQDVYARILEKGATSVVYQGGAGQRPAAPSPAAAPSAPPTPTTVAVAVPFRADDPSRGPAGAKLTVVLFSDFQCPFCARVEPTVKQVEQAYPGAVRVVWKHQPLPATMHPQARPAAEAAEAARAQGKFWEMHERLFEHQRELSADLYPRLARELGLDVARFEKDLAAHAGAARIDEDQREAGQVGANATPTFFVNCRRVEGAYPFESLKPILAEEVKKADALLARGTPASGLPEALCKENVRAFPAAPQAAQNGAPPAGRAAVTVRKDDPVKGPATAAVTVVEFSDFQCPYCGRALPAVREVESAFPKDVRLVWKHLPLPMHPNAVPAALAAEAARAQGGAAKFWAMHDKLFANQQALSPAAYQQYARELGLDLARFEKDMADPRLRARVQDDAQLAQQLGVNGTPTFLVNGETVVGSAALRPAVERALQSAKAAGPVRAAAR